MFPGESRILVAAIIEVEAGTLTPQTHQVGEQAFSHEALRELYVETIQAKDQKAAPIHSRCV